MNKKLLELQKKYAARNQRLQELANSDDVTTEVVSEMTAIRDELKSLGSEIKQLQELAKDAEDANANAGALSSSFRFDAADATNRELQRIGQQAQVLGFQRREGDGVAHVFERDGQRFVEFEGHGLMTEKIFNAISENAYKNAFRNYLLRKGNVDTYDRRVLEVGDDASGGFLVPADYQRRLLERKPAPTSLSGMVSVINTGVDTVILPRVIYEGSDKHIYPNGVRVSWTGEKPASDTVHRATEPTFGQLSIPVGTAMLSMPLTLNFLEDSFMDPLGYVVDKFGVAADLSIESEIVGGPGTEGRMMGILTAPDTEDQISSVVSGSAAALTADGLINLAYELPEQYDENSRWFMNKRRTERSIASLKDSNNRYLFSSGDRDDALATARPKELLGYGISRNPFIPDPAANAFPVLFGDPRGFILARRIGFSVRVLNEVGYQQNQAIVVGRLRVGGKVAEPWMMLAQKCST